MQAKSPAKSVANSQAKSPAKSPAKSAAKSPARNAPQPVDADLLLSLFRMQRIEASGDAFFKSRMLSSPKRYYVELRGATMVMFRNAHVAQDSGIRMRDVIGVFVLKYYQVNVEKKQGQTPRIHVYGPDLEGGQTLYIKAANERQLETWLQALAIAESIDLPGLSSMTVESIIGQGGGGKVFLVRHNEKRENYALKVIDKKHALSSASSLKHIISERILMQIIGQHPFVLPMKFAFQTDANLFIGTPFCGGGDLATYLKNQWKRYGATSPESAPENGQTRRYGGHLTEKATRLLVAEILLALEHLHARGIVYRDLKPENIFIASDGHIRLGDFGLAKHLQPSRLGDGFIRTSSICGTRNYLPPEMLFGKLYGLEVDMWSLGVMVFRIMCGRFPFEAHKTKEVFSKVKREKIRYPPFLSSDAISFLDGLLCRDQGRRLTVAASKKHAFFNSLDWPAVLEKRLGPPIENTDLGRDSTDALDNFDLSKLQGISLGEYVPEGSDDMPIDEDPQGRMSPDGRILGFAYAMPDEESPSPPPLMVKRVSSGGLLGSFRRSSSSGGSSGSGDGGTPVKRTSDVGGFVKAVLSPLSSQLKSNPFQPRQESPKAVFPDRNTS
jgi:serine/threonine protein kinase